MSENEFGLKIIIKTKNKLEEVDEHVITALSMHLKEYILECLSNIEMPIEMIDITRIKKEKMEVNYLKTIAEIKEFRFYQDHDKLTIFWIGIDLVFPEIEKNVDWQTPYFLRFSNNSIGKSPFDILQEIFKQLDKSLKPHGIPSLFKNYLHSYRNYNEAEISHANYEITNQIKGKIVSITLRPWPLRSNQNFYIEIHPLPRTKQMMIYLNRIKSRFKRNFFFRK